MKTIKILNEKQDAEETHVSRGEPYPTLTPAALAAFTQDQYLKDIENAKLKHM